MLTELLFKVLGFWPVRKTLFVPLRRRLAKFEAATHHPREVQERLLRRILRSQSETAFGRDHGFRCIGTVADYRRQVPVAGYERVEPYMDRMRRGELTALVTDPVVHMFALTSGTTAARKYIPVTGRYLADYRRGWQLWGLKTCLAHPEVRFRPIVQLSSDWDEFRTEAGISCGSITGLTAHMQKRWVRWLYCVPACTAQIKDSAAKYYVALRLSLARRVGMLIAANPSTLVALARAGDREKETLIRDIHAGTLSERFEIPAKVRTNLAATLHPQPQRARELEAIADRTGTLYPKDYWAEQPFLIGTWTGGSLRAYLRQFPKYFGEAPVRDIGLLASEGRMTIPLADNTPSGVLDITTHYFEFIPEEEAGTDQPMVLGAHEVEEGRNYFIVPTTAFGLYRYGIHDLVRVTGFHKRTPLIEFLSKGAHFANLTGEKLSEYQVTQAMEQITRELGLPISNYSLAPCWNEELPYYGLFVERGEIPNRHSAEQLAEALDKRLAKVNTEYCCKRDTNRLDSVRVEILPGGAWQRWDRERLARTGGTLEQYKHPCLIADLGFRDAMPVEEEVAAIPVSHNGHRDRVAKLTTDPIV